MVRSKPSAKRSQTIRNKAKGTDDESKLSETSVSTRTSSKPPIKRKKTNMTVLVNQTACMQMSRKMYKEIKMLQINTKCLIPKAPFYRLVREIILEFGPRDTRIRVDALKALQESAELYITQYLEDSYLCTIHAKRKTLTVADMQLARRIRGRQDIINH